MTPSFLPRQMPRIINLSILFRALSNAYDQLLLVCRMYAEEKYGIAYKRKSCSCCSHLVFSFPNILLLRRRHQDDSIRSSLSNGPFFLQLLLRL